MTESVTREVVLPAEVDEVWKAITDPERLGDWFGADVELDLHPGGRAVFHGDDGAVRRGVVEEVDPGHKLSYRWWPYDSGDANPGAPKQTRVELTIEAVPSGTRLLVVEAPLFSASASASVSAGWGGRFEALVWATAAVRSTVAG
jgi:uncharacterized protein YndB with AHSA1/START domain